MMCYLCRMTWTILWALLGLMLAGWLSCFTVTAEITKPGKGVYLSGDVILGKYQSPLNNGISDWTGRQTDDSCVLVVYSMCQISNFTGNPQQTNSKVRFDYSRSKIVGKNCQLIVKSEE